MAKANKKTKSKDEAKKAVPIAEVVAEEQETSKETPKEHKPIVAVSVNRAKNVRHAVQSADVVHTAVALKTCVRFVCGWIVLEAGKEVKARKEVIENLRLQKLVR